MPTETPSCTPWTTLTWTLFPMKFMEEQEKMQKATTAKRHNLFARFTDLATALDEKHLRRLARLLRKLHPLGWEPSPRMIKNFRKEAAEKGCLPQEHQAFKLFMDPLNNPPPGMKVDFKKNELVREPDGDRVEYRDVLSIAWPGSLVEELRSDPDKLREELHHTVDVFFDSMLDSKE